MTEEKELMNDNRNESEELEPKISDRAYDKLVQLMSCENERVALAAAKEIMSIYEKEDTAADGDISLEVTIKVI